MHGHFVDLFDANLSILESVTLRPGGRHFLFDLDRARPSRPAVLASACKSLGAEGSPDGSFRFFAEGPDGIEAVVLVALPSTPAAVSVDEKTLARDAWKWDDSTKTLVLRFPGAAAGRWVRIK